MQRDIVAMVLQYPVPAAITMMPRDVREWYAPRLMTLDIRIGDAGRAKVYLLLFRVWRIAVCGWELREFRH